MVLVGSGSSHFLYGSGSREIIRIPRIQIRNTAHNRVRLSLLYHTTESDCPCCITQQSPTVPAVSHNRVRLYLLYHKTESDCPCCITHKVYCPCYTYHTTESDCPCCITQQSPTPSCIIQQSLTVPAVSHNRVWLSLLYHTTESDCPCCIILYRAEFYSAQYNTRVRLRTLSHKTKSD